MVKKRVIHYLILVAVVIVANFFIPRLLPGSPVKTIMGGEGVESLTAAEKMGILDAYHLNDPLPIQFLQYLRDLFTLNWGDSFSKRMPITQLLAPAAGWTLLLAGSGLVISCLLGCFLGAVSALRRKKGRDLPLILGATAVSAIPSFWIGLLLLAVLGAQLGWFPTYGAYSMWQNYQGLARVGDVLHHLFLPLFTLVITSAMPYFTTTRYSVLRTVGEDYVRMARLRGIPEKRITLWYIMRNTLIPVFTTVMMDVGYLLSGTVLIEVVFSYPGLGSLMQDAVTARDYPLIQYAFLLSSLLTIAALLAADLCYKRIDPAMEVDDEQ